MRVNRFFVEENIEKQEEVIISNSDIIHQVRKVLRLQPGDLVCLFDGQGAEVEGSIKDISGENVSIINTKFKKDKDNFKIKINLASALIKKDKYEWVLQKCTEIGVSQFSPIISERTEKDNLNFERAKKIIIEASEQSGRKILPVISEVVNLKSFLESCETDVLVFHTEGDMFNLSKKNDFLKGKNEITVLIGPEGGWSPEEIDLFKEREVKIFKLGNQVLRAETASIAISAILMFS